MSGHGVLDGSATAPPLADPHLPGPEWWERLAARWAAWRLRHEVLAQRLTRARTVALWLALPVLMVLLVVFDEFRAGLRIWFWLYLLLLAWFVVARTKTVSWRLVAGTFAAAVPASVVIAGVSLWLAEQAGGVRNAGPGTVIAGMTEESLKLVPLAVLAVAAPGRVRRFAVVDWLLLGFACGLAFQAFEELARRTSLEVVRPGLLGLLDRLLADIGGGDPYGPGSGYPQYGFSLLAGGSSTDLAAYAGHHVFTGLVAGTVGLAVAAWRRADRLASASTGAIAGSGPGGRAGTGIGWRVLAVAAPPAAWLLVVSDHAGYNATARTRSRAWADAEDATMPWPLRATWDWFGHGSGRGWLLLGLLLLALLVDARRLRRAEPLRPPSREQYEDAPPPIVADPGRIAAGWARRLPAWRPAGSQAANALTALARWTRAAAAAACALAAYLARDVLVVLGAHGRQPGEPRLSAMAYGRLALAALRDGRAAAMDAAAPADTVRGRRAIRVAGLAALACLLAAGLVLAPALAEQVGLSLTGRFPTWLAGLFDALGDWWDGLGIGGQIAVGVGIAALIALSGGSLGFAFGISGVATYLLDHGHGLATFTRDPGRATRDYLATTTPQGAILDLAEFGLTFAPGNFAGAAAGQYGRRAVLRTVGPDANLGRLAAGRSVILSDGTTLAPLGEADQLGFVRWGDELPWEPARGTGAARDYQVRIYGENEPLISRPGQPRNYADGLNRDYGSVGDAKFRDNPQSFYDPDSLHPSIQPIARRKIDNLLLGYKQVLEDSGNPAQALELMTNDPRVARVFAERMRALGIRGYVVVNP